MEDIIRYILDPHLLSPEKVRIFDYIRYFFVVISTLMTGAIIYFVFRTGILEEKYYKDVLEFTKSSPYKEVKVSKKWKRLKEKIEDENSSERKLAIIQMDDLVSEVLMEMGYEGDDLEVRLRDVGDDILTNKKDLIKAHRKRRDLVYDPNKNLSVEEAKELSEVYKETLVNLQVI